MNTHVYLAIKDYYLGKRTIESLVDTLELDKKACLMNNQIRETNNGESIQVFVQYGSILMERIGSNFYLSCANETYHLEEENVRILLRELDYNECNNPLTAAEYLYKQKDRFKKISI